MYQMCKSFVNEKRTKEDIAMWILFAGYSFFIMSICNRAFTIINILLPDK